MYYHEAPGGDAIASAAVLPFSSLSCRCRDRVRTAKRCDDARFGRVGPSDAERRRVLRHRDLEDLVVQHVKEHFFVGTGTNSWEIVLTPRKLY